MGNLLAYSGIVTKVRAMQAKLLTDEDFQNIAAFHTVTEVAAYLKEHPGYRNVLADMDENRLHRGEIEKLLVQSLYSDYTLKSDICQAFFLKNLLTGLTRLPYSGEHPPPVSLCWLCQRPKR